MKYEVNRNLASNENCSGQSILKGTIVYGYSGCTYGCISPEGTAVTLEEGREPFYEFPTDSLTVLA